MCGSFRAGLSAGQLGQQLRRSNVTGMMRNIMLSNSGFPQAQEFLRKLSAVRARSLKTVLQPCSRPKKFKECQFESDAKLLD